MESVSRRKSCSMPANLMLSARRWDSFSGQRCRGVVCLRVIIYCANPIQIAAMNQMFSIKNSYQRIR